MTYRIPVYGMTSGKTSPQRKPGFCLMWFSVLWDTLGGNNIMSIYENKIEKKKSIRKYKPQNIVKIL